MGSTAPREGDGVRAQAVARQMVSAVLPQPVVAVTAGPSLAPQSGISGPVNQVGGVLSQGVPLRIIEERIKQWRRFFYTGREIIVHLGAPASDRDALSWLEEQITNMLNRLQDYGVSADDQVSLLLNSMDSTLNPLCVSFKRTDQLDAQSVLDNVSHVLQSNNLFLRTAPLYVKLRHFKEPHGSARHCDKLSPASTYSHNIKGIITIQNGDDTLCLDRALIVAKAVCDVKREPGCMNVNTFRQIKMGRPIQKLNPEELSRVARLNLAKGVGLTELKQFQTYLSEYEITVFRKRRGKQGDVQTAFLKQEIPPPSSSSGAVIGMGALSVILTGPPLSKTAATRPWRRVMVTIACVEKFKNAGYTVVEM
uniref:Uncharacterized protein n=1 Tax=Timema shepardi TaxID=629360 RepID=A0A7R9B460_TIMSH|nr:unnamed protein product [Timema shepardi]